MSTRVEITFGKDGSVRSEVIGVKGDGCEEKTAFLDEVFGRPQERLFKDSYYEEVETDKDSLVDGLPSGFCG